MEFIEAVLAPGFVDGLEDRPTGEVRERRDECRAVEESVSYYRRLAQGRLEILEAWQERRRTGGSLGDLVADLPGILAGDGARSSTTTSRIAEPHAPVHILEWPDGSHQLVTGASGSDLAALDDAEVEARLAQLRAFERELSAIRRRIHGVLDRIEGELAAREASDAR